MIVLKFISIVLVMAMTTTISNAAIYDHLYVPKLLNPFSWFSQANKVESPNSSPSPVASTTNMPTTSMPRIAPIPRILLTPTRTSKYPTTKQQAPPTISPMMTTTTTTISAVHRYTTAKLATSAPPSIEKRNDDDSIAQPDSNLDLTTKAPTVAATTQTPIPAKVENTASPPPMLTPTPILNDELRLNSELMKKVEQYNLTEVTPRRNLSKPISKFRYIDKPYNDHYSQTNKSQNSLMSQKYVLATDFDDSEISNTQYDIEDSKGHTGVTLGNQTNMENQSISLVLSGNTLGNQTNAKNQSISLIIPGKSRLDHDHSLTMNKSDPVVIQASSSQRGSSYTLGESLASFVRWFNLWGRTY